MFDPIPLIEILSRSPGIQSILDNEGNLFICGQLAKSITPWSSSLFIDDASCVPLPTINSNVSAFARVAHDTMMDSDNALILPSFPVIDHPFDFCLIDWTFAN